MKLSEWSRVFTGMYGFEWLGVYSEMDDKEFGHTVKLIEKVVQRSENPELKIMSLNSVYEHLIALNYPNQERQNLWRFLEQVSECFRKVDEYLDGYWKRFERTGDQVDPKKVDAANWVLHELLQRRYPTVYAMILHVRNKK